MAHEFLPERALGTILIVRPAPEPDAMDSRLAAARHFFDVVEFQLRARHTPPAGLAREGALPAVALPDGTPHTGRNMPRARRGALPCSWLGAGSELSPLELLNQ